MDKEHTVMFVKAVKLFDSSSSYLFNTPTRMETRTLSALLLLAHLLAKSVIC